MNARAVLLVALLQSLALAQGREIAPAVRSSNDGNAVPLAAASPGTEALDSSSKAGGSLDATASSSDPAAADHRDLPNPSIDMSAFLRISTEAAAFRATHRLSEDEFLRMSQQPGAIVLDARSADMYRLLHVKGAINLSFPDITVDSLQRTIPDKSTRVLIYCNNNFTGAQKAFPTKLPSASLNLSTYVALYTYGYRNIYELGPTMDLQASKLVFEGSP